MAIHIAITRKVLPGKEEEFKAALHQFMGESFDHHGVHGAFYASKQFLDWEAYASKITEKPVYQELNGLEAWFRSPVSPPRWKMALVTLCGVFPTSVFLFFTIGPLMTGFPVPLRLLITSAAMVGLLTWLVMPFLTKLLKDWIRS